MVGYLQALGFRLSLVILLAAGLSVALLQCGSRDAGVAGSNGETIERAISPTPVVWGEQISCTAEVVADRDQHFNVLRNVRETYRLQIHEIPGVDGSGIGAVYESGEKTDAIGIVIHFDDAVYAASPSSLTLIPMFIEGCRVSVEIGPKSKEL